MKEYIVWIAIILFAVTVANAFVDITQAKEIERIYQSTSVMQELNGRRFSDIEFKEAKLLEALDYVSKKVK